MTTFRGSQILTECIDLYPLQEMLLLPIKNHEGNQEEFGDTQATVQSQEILVELFGNWNSLRPTRDNSLP